MKVKNAYKNKLLFESEFFTNMNTNVIKKHSIMKID